MHYAPLYRVIPCINQPSPASLGDALGQWVARAHMQGPLVAGPVRRYEPDLPSRRDPRPRRGGYSRLMVADEEGTLKGPKALRRELADPKIAEHHGGIVKTTGGGGAFCSCRKRARWHCGIAPVLPIAVAAHARQ